MKRIALLPALAMLLFICIGNLVAQRIPPDAANVVYAKVDSINLLADVYLPKNAPKPYPVVVWIHGGAWQSGSKENPSGLFLLDHGFAVVSINYRLSGQALWPAQIYDCKGAIRWLRAKAASYNIDPARIGVFGSSAGGHLVAMLGTGGGVAALEGDVGGNLSLSSSVQAVCDWYGPSNMETIGNYPSGIQHNAANSPEGLMLGGAIPANPDKAKSASPITYVSRDDPPFLIQHGTKDNTVPFHQSVELDSALRAVRVDVTFIPIVDGTHGGGFNVDTVTQRVIDFFVRTLKPAASDVEETAMPALQITVTPNPVDADASLGYTIGKFASVRIELYDERGALVGSMRSDPVAPGTHHVPLSALAGDAIPAGVYLLRISDGAGCVTMRVVVTR